MSKRLRILGGMQVAFFKTRNEAEAFRAAMDYFAPRSSTSIRPVAPVKRGQVGYSFKFAVDWNN